MAIQELSKEEIEVVAGGLVLLGLNIGAILNSILTPLVSIVANALTVVANVVAGVGNILVSVLNTVGNVLVKLGL